MTVDQDFSLGCVTFKMPVKSLSEDKQMSLEFMQVVQPGNIWGVVYCRQCLNHEGDSMGLAKQ